jgi:hypothetical protein
LVMTNNTPIITPYRVLVHGFDVIGQVPVAHPINLYTAYPAAPPKTAPANNRIITSPFRLTNRSD